MAAAQKSSPWIWISLFLIVGLFAAFIFFLDQKIVKSARQPVESYKPNASIEGPRIDFYEVLKERSFDVPDDRKEKVKNAQSKINKSATQTAEKARYMLQAGSFKKPEDAERRKAQLALMGLEPIIKKADVKGVAFHRVELGPFTDDGFYSKVKNRLIANDIPYIQKSLN